MKLGPGATVYFHQLDPPERPPVFHAFSGKTQTTWCGLTVEARHTWSCLVPVERARKFGIGCGRCLVS